MDWIKKNIFSIIIILLIIMLALWIGSAILSKTEDVQNTNEVGSLFALLNERIFALLIVAIITFLFIDRWKRVEDGIDDVKKNQIKALKEVRENAKELVGSTVEATTRKAQSIESKISNLIDEHPWITSITQNDIIPDAPSARIVLRTIENLYEDDSVALIYEYLYSWLENKNNKEKLLGTYDDFLDLSEFCEQKLADDYLGLRFIQHGYNNSTSRTRLLPHYLIRQLRFGDLPRAKKLYMELKSLLHIGWYNRYKAIFWDDTYSNNSMFQMQAFSSLSLYEALKGRKNKSNQFLKSAKAISNNLNEQLFTEMITAEMFIYYGEFSEAEKILTTIDFNKISQDDAYGIYKLSTLIGLHSVQEVCKSIIINDTEKITISTSITPSKELEKEENTQIEIQEKEVEKVEEIKEVKKEILEGGKVEKNQDEDLETGKKL